MKEQIRVVGFDDGFFSSRVGETLIIGVVMRENLIEGILCGKITVDGLDVTEAIVDLVVKRKFYPQIGLIFTSGISFAGFNLLDLQKLYRETKIPVISVSRWKPDIEAMLDVASHFSDSEKRKKIILSAGEVYKTRTRGEVYFQCVGISPEDAERWIKKYAYNSSLPEPVRLAHLIASGVTRGVSSGRA